MRAFSVAMAASITVIIASQLRSSCIFNSYCSWWYLWSWFLKRVLRPNRKERRIIAIEQELS